MVVVSLEKSNTGRQTEFDLLKVILIIGMVFVHVYEKLSIYDTSVLPGTTAEWVLQVGGGLVGASLFMFCMGIGMAYTPRQTPAAFANRGWHLLFYGYLLNLVREGIPLLIISLSGTGSPEPKAYLSALMNVDILHLAGLSFLLVALFMKFRIAPPVMLLIALVLQTAAGLWTEATTGTPVMDMLVGLFVYVNSDTSFPLMLWFVYPTFGYTCGNLLKYVADKPKFYRKLLFGIPPVFVCLWVALSLTGLNVPELFVLAGDAQYRQNMMISTLSFLAFFMFSAVVFFAMRSVRNEVLLRFISSTSANLINIYCIQWVIILWLQMLFGVNKTLTAAWIVPAALAILIISIFFAALYKNILARIRHAKENRSKGIKR